MGLWGQESRNSFQDFYGFWGRTKKSLKKTRKNIERKDKNSNNTERQNMKQNTDHESKEAKMMNLKKSRMNSFEGSWMSNLIAVLVFIFRLTDEYTQKENIFDTCTMENIQQKKH